MAGGVAAVFVVAGVVNVEVSVPVDGWPVAFEPVRYPRARWACGWLRSATAWRLGRGATGARDYKMMYSTIATNRVDAIPNDTNAPPINAIVATSFSNFRMSRLLYRICVSWSGFIAVARP
jgi:hypothetical protein